MLPFYWNCCYSHRSLHCSLLSSFYSTAPALTPSPTTPRFELFSLGYVISCLWQLWCPKLRPCPQLFFCAFSLLLTLHSPHLSPGHLILCLQLWLLTPPLVPHHQFTSLLQIWHDKNQSPIFSPKPTSLLNFHFPYHPGSEFKSSLTKTPFIFNIMVFH